MIEARNLHCQFEDHTIFKNLNVEIPAGKVTSILGPNGAGKSTLLACLCGSRTPEEGDVYLNGTPIQEFSLTELAQKRAVLSQSSVINFPFTAKEIVMMGRNPFSNDHNEQKDEEIVNKVLHQIDAYPLKDRVYPTLSGGEQQRIQLARVFAQLWQQPNACLFLDEPTSALDLKHQHQILQLTRDLAEEQGFTVCIVMHDLNLVKIYSDQVILLKNETESIAGDVLDALTQENIAHIFDVPISLVKQSYASN